MSGADYKKYDKIIDGQQKFGEKGYNSALAEIVIATKYTENMVFYQKDKKNKITVEEYTKLKTKLDEKLFEVTTNNIDFDFQTFATNLTEGVSDRIDGLIKESVIEDLKDTLDSFKIPYTKNFGPPSENTKEFANEFLTQIKRMVLIEDNNDFRKEIKKIGLTNRDRAIAMKNIIEEYLEELE